MRSPDRPVALAVARALLAGPPLAHGLAARTRACLQTGGDWIDTLAQRLAAMPREHWWRLEPRSLADWLQRQAAWQAAQRATSRPQVRRHILRPPRTQPRPPLGLDEGPLPCWPTVGDLARALDLGLAGLWRLTRPPDWQRRSAARHRHYRVEWLPKRHGGWRLLEVPLPHLMAVQRRLQRALLGGVPVHEAAHGFVRGRSVRQHAALHAGQAVLVQFDLRDFFGSVHAGRVHAIFATLGYHHEVARALTALCTAATPEPWLQRARTAGALGWEAAQRLRAAHLPQGAPTSPALANLAAFGLDLRLAALAEAHGARYSRYADDLAFSGGPALRAGLSRLRRDVAAIVAAEGFWLNSAKTRVRTQAQRQLVCGLVVNQQPHAPRQAFDRLRAQLHDCVLHGPAAANRAGHAHWRAHLQGQLSWLRQLDPDKARRLERLWDRIVW